MTTFIYIAIGLVLGSAIVWIIAKLRLALKVTEMEKLALHDKLTVQHDEIQRLEERFQERFENLANRILSNSSQQLTAQNQQQLQGLLSPLKDRLQEFTKKVDDTYNNEAKERHVLKAEIERLMQLNQQMSQDANNLTHALRGDSKTQGNWGEFQLSRILEISGLREGDEYYTQGKEITLRNAEGQQLKPDVIVNLPDNKHLLIDSKVSIKAYYSSVESQNPTDKQRCLDEHVASISTHIDQLSKKHYQDLSTLNTPDFVILFMPSEPALADALRHDRSLFQQAWDRKIIIVSPTLLLAVLRTVASVWLHDKQTKNAVRIAEEGGNLYDKFVGFVQDLEKIGKGLQDAQKFYQESMNKLQFGKGNLLTRVEKLRELGAKTKKRLDDINKNEPTADPDPELEKTL